jgi:tRNA pseudouridine38-40 synthase
MPVYRLDIAYDGSRFHGYAKQRDVRTVQAELEAALGHHVDEVETFVAGRTDRGVHATGQVVSFASNATLDVVGVQRSLNRQLAPEIAVTELFVAPEGFNARFSAHGRAYVYQVLDQEVPDPFLAATAWHFGRPLDLALLNRAAAHFVGERDFATLCRKAGDRSTVRLVRKASWRRIRPGLVAYDVEASSFCHQMVRSMVAISVEAGRGRLDPDAVPALLDRQDRQAGKGAAPPHGLTLVRVDY